MTTWKDGGDCGRIYREIVNENDCVIAKVRTRHAGHHRNEDATPWPEGEANFDLILQAPQTADALRIIAEGAIVSPEQPPEQIAEQTLRMLRLAREDCVKSLEVIGIQQKRAEQAEAALCSIRDQAECILQPLTGPSVSRARWEAVRDRAVAAITATKGEGNDSIG